MRVQHPFMGHYSECCHKLKLYVTSPSGVIGLLRQRRRAQDESIIVLTQFAQQIERLPAGQRRKPEAAAHFIHCARQAFVVLGFLSKQVQLSGVGT